MKSIFRKELIIGALVILALVILFFGINFLKGINLFKAANFYYAVYTDAAGLTQSAPVTINGYKIGLVREIHYDYTNPGHVVVEFSVDRALKIPEGSTAKISADLLGTASIVLDMNHSAAGFYAVGDTIPGETAKGMMDALSDNLMPAVNAIVPKVDTLLTSLNAVVANPALTTSLNRLDQITLDLQASLTALRGTMANLQPIAKDVKSITANVDSITGDLAQVSGQLRNAPVDSMINSLQATVDNLHALTNTLNDPNGTVGKLTADPALYNNLNAAAASLDSLLIDVKKNPKRYISIKLL